MATFLTSDAKVLMPRTIAEGMITQARDESVIARLSAQDPMRFGNIDYIVFNDFPKAEFVEEGGNKSSSKGGFGSVTVTPHKAQVTQRFSDEVLWADEDHQLGVVQALASSAATSLARALDLGLIHRLNPLSGTEINAWDNYLTKTTKVVTRNTADADEDFRAAVGLLMNAKPRIKVTGAAFDPIFSWDLAALKRKDGTGATSDQRYPALGFGSDVTTFQGINVAQGDTVSGGAEASEDTKVRAIVGDFLNGIRWGIQRNIPVEVIRSGDPDGGGDLRRTNQIAIRTEIVYGWYVFPDKFAVVKAA